MIFSQHFATENPERFITVPVESFAVIVFENRGLGQ